MSKNLIPQIAEMLGVEIGEEFKVKGYDGLTYKLTDNGLELTTVDGQKTKWFDHGALNSLLKGKMEIVKLPWKPTLDERYWTFTVRGYLESSSRTWTVRPGIWEKHPIDMALLKAGWIYRTRAEAEAALPKVAAEMGVEYEL